MNQQAIREAFENAVDTYHIYGENSLNKYCEKQVEIHTIIADSIFRVYEHNCGKVGKKRAWDSLIYEVNQGYLERIAIRYFGYDPEEHINE